MIATGLLAPAMFQAGAPAPKAPATELRPETVESWTDGFMATGLRQAQVAGAVVVVVQGDRIVLAKGYGFADEPGKSPWIRSEPGFGPDRSPS
jgi:CubicO group peptidase (beta-lactamase class C family)